MGDSAVSTDQDNQDTPMRVIQFDNGGKGRTYAYLEGTDPDDSINVLTLVETYDLDGRYDTDIEECPNCGSPVDENGCTATNDRKCGLTMDDIIESVVLPHCTNEDCDAVIFTNNGAWVDGDNDYWCANCVEVVAIVPER